MVDHMMYSKSVHKATQPQFDRRHCHFITPGRVEIKMIIQYNEASKIATNIQQHKL
jgi:hypothetical protein